MDAFLIAQRPRQDEDLLAAGMPGPGADCARRPAFQVHPFGIAGLGVQGQDFDARRRAGRPRPGRGVQDDSWPIRAGILAQAHEQQATGVRTGGMVAAVGIEQVGPGRIVAALVGEHPVQHPDFLALGMRMRTERAARRVAHQAGHRAVFAADQVQRLAPDRAAGAGVPS